MSDFSAVMPARQSEKDGQDFVHVRTIEDGVIMTDDKRLVRILEISPINLPMKNIDEQEAIFSLYRSWNKSSPSRFTIKTVTRKTPIDSYKRNFEKALQHENSNGVSEYAKKHIRFTEQLGVMQSTENKAYLIFEYSEEDDYFRSSAKEDKIRFLRMEEANITQEFAAIGNTVISHQDEDMFLCELLYGYYNRKLLYTSPFVTRVNRIINDYKIANNNFSSEEAPCFSIRDVVCPISVNDADSPEYILVDGMYCAYYCIDGTNGFPDIIEAPNGWLSALINFGFGYEVDLHFEKKETADVLGKIQQQSKFARMKLRSRERSASDYEEVKGGVDAMEQMRADLKSNGEEMYDMSVMIGVYAYTKEELFRKTGNLERFAKRQEIKLRSFKYKQRDGFLSMAPLNKLTKRAREMSQRNVPTNVVAATYPFCSFSMNDKGGILLGLHQGNNSLVIFNPYDSKKYSNYNMCCFAEPGRGKTFTLLTIATRLRYLGTQIFILSPDKQDEFRRSCEAMDGLFVDISASSRARINPFDIIPVESETDRLINNKTGEENSWLTEKIGSLGTWLDMMVPDLSRDEKALLNLCLSRMYARRGITTENSSLYTDSKKKQKKTMPVLSDFVEEMYAQEGISKGVISIFEQFTRSDAPFKNLDGQTNVDLSNKFIVFGLEYLSKDIQAPMMFIILNSIIWPKAKADKIKKKAIIIDEGSLLVNGKNENVGEFVVEIFRMSRAYNCSSVFATQTISDLYANNGEFGNAILSCAHTKILLGMSSTDLRFVRNELELTKAEDATIRDFHKAGQAMLCAGGSHIPINVRASQDEFDLFTTESVELARIKAQRQKEGRW